MNKTEIRGAGRISLWGVFHALDRNGKAYCGQQTKDTSWVWDARWMDTPEDVSFVRHVTCARCRDKYIRERA